MCNYEAHDSLNVGKSSIKAITLLQTSPQLEVFTRSYRLPKLWES